MVPFSPRRSLEELGLALGLMTRLPLPAFEVRTDANLATAFWALPLAGLLVGAAAGGVLLLCETAGLPARFGAIAAVALMILLTGALHEDGLADFCDGIGGGHTIERRLEIMRDSRIGAYGVIAVVVVLLAQVELIALQVGAALVPILMIAAAVARGMLAIPFAFLGPARGDGLAAHFGQPSPANLAVGFGWPLALGFWFLPVAAMIALTVGSLVGIGFVSLLAWRYLGGMTGDVLGAAVVAAFTGGMLAMVIERSWA